MARQWNRRLLLAGMSAAIVLGGCRKQPGTAAPVAVSAAPETASAEAMIRSLYAAYATDAGKGVDLSDPAYFSGDLVEQNLAYQKREVEYDGEGTIEADPLCQCPGTMDANATIKPFKDSADVIKLTLKLVKTPAGWRIDDVVPADPSQGLRALYARDMEQDKKLEKPKHK